MLLYCRDGVVLASHDETQNLPASLYGEDVVVLIAPEGYAIDPGGPVPEGAVEAPVRVYKADIWRRATDQEAETIDSALSAQPVRLRNLFRDAAYLSSDDELYPVLQAAFVAAFGADRAEVLLAAS